MAGFLERLKTSPTTFKFLLNTYAPYLGAGVRMESASADYRRVRVSMALRWYNRNYVGTHFGGSLYAMVDPFFMLMLMQVLGRDYIVWDKAASIEFVKPGKGRVYAEFVITDDMLAAIHEELKRAPKALPVWPVEIKDAQGEVVARVLKTLYVRPKAKRACVGRA